MVVCDSSALNTAGINQITIKILKTMTLLKLNNQFAKQFDPRPRYNELFNDLFESFLSTDSKQNLVPAVNIHETDDKFNVSLAAPGLTKEDFKISIEHDVLSISAEKKEEKNETNARYTRKEYEYTSFKRSFNLPEMVSTEGIKANYENGILSLDIPKKELAKPAPVQEIKIS